MRKNRNWLILGFVVLVMVSTLVMIQQRGAGDGVQAKLSQLIVTASKPDGSVAGGQTVIPAQFTVAELGKAFETGTPVFLKPGQYTITTFAPGYQQETKKIEIGQKTELHQGMLLSPISTATTKDGANSNLETKSGTETISSRGTSSRLTRDETERAIRDWFEICRSGDYDEADKQLHRVARNYYGGFGIDLPKSIHDEMQKGTEWTWQFKEEAENLGSGLGHGYVFRLLEDGRSTHSIATAIRENGKIKVIVIES